jgi:pyruvate ferredoxin oxidoreductase gamma subunit/2-oxoisovalerate ferredoxin oxidoreductase gamma subunit
VERRGAPVEAFLRIDDDKILIRNNIYTPDHIVVLDPTLIDAVDVTTGLAKGGWIIINSPKTPDQFPALSDYKIACVDASAIAIKYRLGARSAPIVNTAICGAFASATKMVGLKAIQEAILEEVPIKAEANSEAAKLAFEQTAV